jgi:hypothetical protein
LQNSKLQGVGLQPAAAVGTPQTAWHTAKQIARLDEMLEDMTGQHMAVMRLSENDQSLPRVAGIMR